MSGVKKGGKVRVLVVKTAIRGCESGETDMTVEEISPFVPELQRGYGFDLVYGPVLHLQVYWDLFQLSVSYSKDVLKNLIDHSCIESFHTEPCFPVAQETLPGEPYFYVALGGYLTWITLAKRQEQNNDIFPFPIPLSRPELTRNFFSLLEPVLESLVLLELPDYQEIIHLSGLALNFVRLFGQYFQKGEERSKECLTYLPTIFRGLLVSNNLLERLERVETTLLSIDSRLSALEARLSAPVDLRGLSERPRPPEVTQRTEPKLPIAPKLDTSTSVMTSDFALSNVTPSPMSKPQPNPAIRPSDTIRPQIHPSGDPEGLSSLLERFGLSPLPR